MDADNCNVPGTDLIPDQRFRSRHREEARRLSVLDDLIGKALSILAFMVITFVATAQSSGKLQLRIDPPTNFSYKLDHQFTMQKSDLELLEGAHHFSFWAPQRRVVDTTITLAGGEDRTFALRLPFSPDYLIYQRDLKVFRNERRLTRLLPAAVTGASLLYTVVRYGRMKKAHDRLDADHTAYDEAASPFAITVLKETTIPAHSDAFKKARTGYEVATGVTVLFAAATAYMYLRSAQQKKPVFIDREKIRFDGLSWMPGVNGGEWTGGLTWNFSR